MEEGGSRGREEGQIVGAIQAGSSQGSREARGDRGSCDGQGEVGEAGSQGIHSRVARSKGREGAG